MCRSGRGLRTHVRRIQQRPQQYRDVANPSRKHDGAVVIFGRRRTDVRNLAAQRRTDAVHRQSPVGKHPPLYHSRQLRQHPLELPVEMGRQCRPHAPAGHPQGGTQLPGDRADHAGADGLQPDRPVRQHPLQRGLQGTRYRRHHPAQIRHPAGGLYPAAAGPGAGQLALRR